MCEGFYNVTVIDANGDSLYYGYLINAPANVVDNNNYSDSTVVDTIAALLEENCDINYQDIDSSYINSISFDSLNHATVHWVVFYNGTETTVITDVYALMAGNGVYTLELNLYCPNRATQNILKVSDQIYYHSDLIGSALTNGIFENDLEIKIYPVPFNNEINIELNKVDNYNVSVFDLSGKLVVSQNNNNTNQISLQLNSIAKGQYIVVIKNDTQIITKKIIK